MTIWMMRITLKCIFQNFLKIKSLEEKFEGYDNDYLNMPSMRTIENGSQNENEVYDRDDQDDTPSQNIDDTELDEKPVKKKKRIGNSPSSNVISLKKSKGDAVFKKKTMSMEENLDEDDDLDKIDENEIYLESDNEIYVEDD